jgi:D-3-phosphoglycerate dehydrogenase
VNCARGGLVDEEAVMSGLESGQVAGAAFDVFTTEPARESVLFGHPAVVCTPHLGAATTEAQEKVALQVAQQMSDFLLTGAVTNAINMASVTAEDAPRLQPYMELAENLGSFAGQLTETGIQSVSIEFEGHVATLNTRPLVSAALMGLLAPMLNSVNMVSAPAVARERNISVTESKNEQPGDYETLIRVTVETEHQSRSITGTLFGGGKARIVNIKDIEIEAEFAPHMLYITNKDQPGVIGDLGRTLSDAGVNIASFHLGRAFVGGDAIALIQVDQPVTSTLLDAVAMLPNVVQTKSLAF